MKRLIAMLALFFVMIGFSIFEIVYIQKFYSGQYELLTKLEAEFDASPENIDTDACLLAMQNADEYWQSGKKYIMMFGNHNGAKYIDEKMVSLSQLIQMNQPYDAYVALKSLQVYVQSLKQDVLPHADNFL